MRSFQGASAALAIVLAGVLQAGQPNFDDYKSFTAPGYTLIARDEVYAVRVARGVAKVDWLLSKMLKHDADVPVAPTYILAVPRPVFIRYFQPGNGIIGEFVPGRFSNYLLIESTRDERELADAVYHEYTHLFLHTRFRGAKPLWFDEGMAEFVQAARFKDTYVEVGRGRYPPSKWIPLNKLLRLDKSSPEYRSLATTNSVHDESWAIVHRGVLADMHFRKQMFGLLDALDELKPIDEAVYANFGMTVLQLDASMHDYAQNIAFAEVRLPFETPAKPEPPTGSPLSELATLERIADAMFVSGFQPQNLHEIVEAINQRSPDSPGGRVLRMRLAARDHDDATLSALSREIAPETATPMLARGTGMALF
jgi:hypothetical protein